MAASLAWTSSRAALPLLRNGSLPWRPEVSGAAAELQASLAKADPEAFARAVDRALVRRMDALVRGILAYRRHGYRRELADPPVLWQQGTTRLLDYGDAGGGRTGAGGAVAHQPRLHPGPGGGLQLDALAGRQGLSPDPGRLGPAGAGGARLHADRLRRRASGGRRSMRSSPKPARRRCWSAIAWAACSRSPWPSAGAPTFRAWRCWPRPGTFMPMRAARVRWWRRPYPCFRPCSKRSASFRSI